VKILFFSAAWQQQRHIFATGSAFCALKASTPSGRGAVVAWGDVLQGGRTPQGPLGHTGDVSTMCQHCKQNQTGTVNWQMCITTWEGSEMWNDTKLVSSWHVGRTIHLIYDLWCFPWREALCFYVLVSSGRAIYVFSVAWQFRFRPAEARRGKTCLLNQRRSLCSCQGGPFRPSFPFVAGIGQLIQQIEHVLSTSVGFARIWSFFFLFTYIFKMWCHVVSKVCQTTSKIFGASLHMLKFSEYWQDGEVVTWGSSVDGGDSSRVHELLKSRGIRHGSMKAIWM